MLSILSKNQGFTITELVIVLLIVGLGLSLAIPSFTTLMQRNRAISTANELVSALFMARSEAIKRATPVTLCVAQDEDLNSCGVGGWDTGWLVFVDSDNNASFNGDDERIMVHTALKGELNIATTPANISSFTYNTLGLSNQPDVTFTITPQGCSGPHGGREIIISSTGRPTINPIACP